MSFWWSNIFTVFFIYQTVSAKCLEHDYEIQDYLISSKPPWDNYYNISKAVYPSIDLPSLLLKITVEFLSTAIQNASTASSTSAASINQSESDTRLILKEIKMYTWSMSCLYVSAGDVSLFAMRLFSLGTIWPSRRERQLRIKLPEFCHGVPQKEQMEYFLSTVGMSEVTAACDISGNDKLHGGPCQNFQKNFFATPPLHTCLCICRRFKVFEAFLVSKIPSPLG